MYVVRASTIIFIAYNNNKKKIKRVLPYILLGLLQFNSTNLLLILLYFKACIIHIDISDNAMTIYYCII